METKINQQRERRRGRKKGGAIALSTMHLLVLGSRVGS
jgi:hypothetical protein